MAKKEKKNKVPAKTLKAINTYTLICIVFSVVGLALETYAQIFASWFGPVLIASYVMFVACVIGWILLRKNKTLNESQKVKWVGLLQLGVTLIYIFNVISTALRSGYYVFHEQTIGEQALFVDDMATAIIMMSLVFAVVSLIVVLCKTRYINAPIRAEKKAQKKEIKNARKAEAKALAEKRAEEKRIQSEQKAEEKRVLAEQKAKEKELELEAKTEQEQQEAEQVVAVTAEEKKQESVKTKALKTEKTQLVEKVEKVPFKFKDIKKYQLITTGIALVLMVLICVIPKGFGEILNLLLIPAISITFMLFGIYLVRHLNGWWKTFGVVSILFCIISYAIMVTCVTYGTTLTSPFLNLAMPLFPYWNGEICFVTLAEYVFDGFNATTEMLNVYWASMSTTLYVGTLLYLFFPAKKILKDKQEVADKESPLRYYICMFSSITTILVILVLLLWLGSWLLSVIFGVSGNSSSTSTSSSSSGASSSAETAKGDVCFVNDYGSIVLEIWEFNKLKDVREGGNPTVMKFDGHRFYPYGKDEHVIIGVLNESVEKPYIEIYPEYSSEFGKYHHLYLSYK